MTQEWLTVHELAETFRVHESLITRLIQDGELEAYRIGLRRWRVPRSGWEQYLERQRARPRE